MVKSKNVVTKFELVSMIITYDSTKAITVTKQNNTTYFVKQYDLETYALTFEETISGRYIKLKEVEQSPDGKNFVICYNDDGQFYLRTFAKVTRTEEEIKANEVDINKIVGINDYTMCNTDFPDPFMTTTFLADETKVFVNLFHNYSYTHYHFIYDMKSRAVVGSVQSKVLECGIKNFPYRSFYNPDDDEVYSFYRQGHAFIVDAKDSSKYSFNRMTEMDIGQMYLIYNEALVTRSSSDILFFKVEEVEDPLTREISREWKQYHILQNLRGFVYYIKGNIRIQITTEEKINIYLINKETFMPKLENVMFNFMKCTQMMIGSKVRFCVTYKTNEKSFDIYRRKYEHSFKVPVWPGENLEGS